MHQHYADELLEVDPAVSVRVRNLNHFFDVVVREVALQTHAKVSKLVIVEFLNALLVENLKRFLQLLLSLSVFELRRHEAQKFVLVNITVSIFVNVRHDLR